MFRMVEDSCEDQVRMRDTKHDYFTVLSDGGESQPLPTWKTYCKFTSETFILYSPFFIICDIVFDSPDP